MVTWSPEFPYQNQRKIGQGVHELWADIQTKNINYYFMYIYFIFIYIIYDAWIYIRAWSNNRTLHASRIACKSWFTMSAAEILKWVKLKQVVCARVALRKGLKDILSWFYILNLVRHALGKTRDPRIKYRFFMNNCWSIVMYCT